MKLLKLTIAIAVVGFAFLSFINETNKVHTGLKIGNSAPLINEKTIDGLKIDLNSLKGKMVLIDFWASYDANSRIANSEKSALYQEFQANKFSNADGFTIVSISLDRFKNPVIKAIATDNLVYPLHICDYKGNDSPLVKLYRGQNMVKYLLDGDGRIVTSSTSLSDIKATLQKLSQKQTI